MNNLPHRLAWTGLLLFAWTASLALFFRGVFFSSFANVVGDPADGQLIVSIHEHWFRVLQGLEGWHNLQFFYPVENTLGYSDTFLGTGIIFSLLRFTGLDAFLSIQLVLLLLGTIGFWGMYAWLQHWRGLSPWAAVLGATLFVIASPIYLASRNSHLQLLSIWLFPLGIILIEMSLLAFRERRDHLWIPAALFAFWFGLLTYSTFYVAFFFGLLLLISLVGFSFLYGARESLHFLKERLPQLRGLLPALGIIGLWAGLFLVTYLPVRQEMGGRPLGVVLKHLPLPWDLFNHSTTNLLWGSVAERIWAYPEELSWGLELGFTPLIFFTVVILSVWILIRGKSEAMEPRLAALTFLAGTLLLIRVDNLTFWILPFHLLPGSEGIRAAFRFNLALLLPALYVLMVCLERAFQENRFPGRILLAGFVIILGLEQIQLVTNANLSRRERLELAASASTPPHGLEAFYAFGSPWRGYQKDVPHNTAGYLSQVWNLPTLNGRSGQFPPGWELYEMVPGAAFPRITPWARSKGISGRIGLYDLDNHKWGRVLDFSLGSFANLSGRDFMSLPPDSFATLAGEGWSGQEVWGVWSVGSQAVLHFHPENFPEMVTWIEFEGRGFVHSSHPRQEVRVFANDTLIATLVFTPERQEQRRRIALPQDLGPLDILEFHIGNPQSPKDLGLGSDTRQLGIGIHSLVLGPGLKTED